MEHETGNINMLFALSQHCNKNCRCGCNVNAKSSWSEKTALAVAAFAGELDVFELLINHGASGIVINSLKPHFKMPQPKSFHN